MNRSSIVVAVGLAFLGGLVMPWGSRAEDAPKDTKDVKVRKLMELMGTANVGKQVMQGMMAQFKPMEQHGKLPPGFCDKVTEVAKPEELTEQIVPVYLEHLEEGDVDAALAYWESPAGKRFSAAQPEIQKATMTAGQKWGQELFQKTQQAFQAGGGGNAAP